MIEQVVERDGQKIIQVRSNGGKLLFVKTKVGYEIKCPRIKKICVIKYKKVLMDCLQCLDECSKDDCDPLLDRLKKKLL